jgi:hypothetical protein
LPDTTAASIPLSFDDDGDGDHSMADAESEEQGASSVENATLESSVLPGIDCLYSPLFRH